MQALPHPIAVTQSPVLGCVLLFSGKPIGAIVWENAIGSFILISEMSALLFGWKIMSYLLWSKTDDSSRLLSELPVVNSKLAYWSSIKQCRAVTTKTVCHLSSTLWLPICEALFSSNLKLEKR